MKLSILPLFLLFFIAQSCLHAEPADSLAIIITGSYRGRADGCKCPYGSKGGLARRASVLEKMFSGDKILGLDCGGLLDLDPEGGRLRSLCTIKGLQRQGLQIIGVETRDLFYGVDFIGKIADSLGIELICANIVQDRTREPVFEPYAKIDFNGWDINLAGLAEHVKGLRIPGVGTWITLPADSALDALKAALIEPSDLNILLTDMSEQSLRRVLPKLPQIQIVFTSSRKIITPSPFWIDSIMVVRPMMDGGAVNGVKLPPGWNRTVDFRYLDVPLNRSIDKNEAAEEWLMDCLGRTNR